MTWLSLSTRVCTSWVPLVSGKWLVNKNAADVETKAREMDTLVSTHVIWLFWNSNWYDTYVDIYMPSFKVLAQPHSVLEMIRVFKQVEINLLPINFVTVEIESSWAFISFFAK